MEKSLNNLCHKIVGIQNQINCLPSYNEVNHLQKQLDTINKNYLDLVNKHNIENSRYKQIIGEIDNLYNLLEQNYENVEKISETTNGSSRSIYTCPSEIHKLVIDQEINLIFITIVGAGGAGGIGTVKDMYYYSGGGGGAGSCYIKKPVEVSKGSILYIKVGKGASIDNICGGEDSFVEIYNLCHEKVVVLAEGGANGCPSYKDVFNVHDNCEHFLDKVCGGKGGNSCCNPCFDGGNGDPGNISIPSQCAAYGGNGGCSHFYKGGDGGGNYFNCGGIGGNLDSDIVGKNGKYGSGGGGSAPKISLDPHTKLSGNGGNGFVMIEWV